jgi:choline dehydrogenase
VLTFSSLHSESENYTAPLPANQEVAGVIVDESYHGQSGPIHYSYPGFFYEQTTGSWIETLGNLGIESRDPANGNSYGAFIATSAIDPTTWSRSYSKTGYLDPYASRTNLVVLTGYQATKASLGSGAGLD